MDRLISEKSVMEVIYGCDWFIDEEHTEVIKERIKAIPSAEPKWIPVSERLPEEKQDVLACFYNGNGDYKLMVSCRIDYNYWNGVGRTGDMVAWMPLPKLYETQESEDKE